MNINLKNIELRSHLDLYNELEKLVKFKDYHAVVKDEENFYIGGLTIRDIKKASVSQEDIQKLHTGLKERDISYAIQESDVNKGYMPLILNDHTRSFFRKELKGIINSDNLIWRIFCIPFEFIDNHVRLKNAELLINESDEYDHATYELTYNDIDDKLKNIISLGSNSNELHNEDEAYNNEYGEILQDDFFDDETETQIDTEKSNQEENITDEVEEDKENNTKQENSEMLEHEGNQLTDKTQHKEDDLKKDLEFISENHDTSIPPEIESFLDDLYLGRFSEYESLDEADTTHILMQKEIKNANDTISVREQNIKRKAKELFFRYMEQSVKKINEVIDIENGNEVVKNKYFESEEKKANLDIELEENIGIHKRELEEAFWGKHFTSYKEKTLAGLESQFEKEEYYNLVSEPLERFINSESNRMYEHKDRIEMEVYKWREDVKKSALESDRDNAVLEVEEYINKAIKNCQKEIGNLEKTMNNLNEKFIKHEYSKKAEENLRNSLSDELKTDEEAKRYKKRLEQAEKEKEKLTQDLEELEDKYINDFESIKQERENIEKDIEENHQKIISSKEEELNTLKHQATKLEEENKAKKQQLENTGKKAKKKVIGTSIGAAALVIILGGTSIGSHNNNKEIQDKLDSQNKIVEKKDDEMTKKESEIKKLKEDQEKQKQLIDRQKKELDKKKEDKKKDKKKDKK